MPEHPWQADLEPLAYPPFVSVILAALDEEETIGRQLEALAGQDYEGPWELIVVDNGSKDGTLEVVEGFRARLPRLVAVSRSEKRAPAYARNRGVEMSSGQVLCFCDADDVVRPGWITSYALTLCTAVAATGPVYRTGDRGRDSQPWLLTRPPFAFLRWVSSGNFAIRRQLWDKLGGFQEDWPDHAEELDFAWRLQLDGWTYAYAPQAGITCHVPHDARGIFRQKFRWSQAEVFAYARYRKEGMPRTPIREALRSYSWLLTRLPIFMARWKGWDKWVWTAALRLGRLSGSLRYRTLCL